MNNSFLLENINLARYTTFKIGGTARYFAVPKNSDELIYCMNFIKEKKIKHFILGNGSNILFDDKNFDGMIVSLSQMNKIDIKEKTCVVEAGVLLPVLANKLLNEGYTNFAWSSHIPGSIGGSIFGNAEAHKSSISDDLVSITVLKNNEIEILKKEDIIFNYRSSNLTNEIILAAEFNIVKEDINNTLELISNWKNYRNKFQPVDKKSAGSTFRNPEGVAAGKLIEDAGLKGYSIGGAKISEKHANFIINENKANFDDIVNLINYTQKVVNEKFNVELIPEVKIVQWDKL